MAPHWEGKKYKMVKSENFDEYMKALGVGFATRKIGAAWKPSFELIKQNDNQYIIRSTSSVKNVDLPFTVGVEFDETTTDGRNVKTTITFENENKLVHIQNGDVDSKIIREFTEKGLVATLKAKDVVCTRTYELEA